VAVARSAVGSVDGIGAAITSIVVSAMAGTLALALLLFVAPSLGEAQQTTKVPRIGFLRSGPPPQAFVEGFRQGLRELGYVEGQNIIVEYRIADKGESQLADLGSELLGLKVNVILASATPAALAAKDLTRTVPIVFAAVLDPIDSGLVNGLSRPGGNVTGTSFMSIDLATKRVELLKEIVPQLSRLAVLGNLAHPSYASQIRAIESGARSLGVQVESIGVRSANDFGTAFRTAQKAQVLIQLDDVLFTSHRSSLTELAVANRLPAVYGFREHVEAGGLMSYGPNFRELYRRAAVFVDKILKGAKPADLPVEQPTKFELMINLKTAKALGITIPDAVLLRADEVLQ
jgi:putative ABC transport system substrate-binding protein